MMPDTIAQLNTALIGRYQVEREIGAGGMATVYLARDQKHDRSVALKLLKPELGAVLGVDRFLSEIKVTAHLQHPNLLPLFDSGAAGTLLFYVMPFVEGESLRARLDRESQLPVEDAVRIAVAVASALDYAHRQGVIHRDLKPENILLHEGQPLVADFGIALAVSNAGGARVTQTGLSLGTPQYMSPEQATGDRLIDGRSDIYSLAAVTYEMLVGEPPHTGASAQAIIARLLTERPRSVRASRPSVPDHVEAALEHALEKLAADRWLTAGEFANALQGRGVWPSRKADVKPTARARAQIAVGYGAAVVGIVAAIVAWTRLAHIEVPGPLRFTLNVPAGQQLVVAPGASIAISHDGRAVAYVATGPQSPMLYVRRLEALQATGIPLMEPASDLKFSPDDHWISFVRPQGTIMRVATVGGTPDVIARTNAVQGTSWSADGRFVYASGGAIWRVDTPGASPTKIFHVDSASSYTDVAGPYVFPDAKDVIFGVVATDGVHAAVVSMSGGRPTITDAASTGQNIIGYRDGWMLYGRDNGTINAIRYDQHSRRSSGESVSLLDGALFKFQGGVEASLSNTGTLSYLRGDQTVSLLLLDGRGTSVMRATEQGEYSNPVWSPDGRKIAIEMTPSAGAPSGIWIYDIGSKALSRVRTKGAVSRPAWTGDSKRIAYVSFDGNRATIWSAPVDASEPEAEFLTLPGQNLGEVSLTLDGKFAALRTDNSSLTKGDIYAVDLQGNGERAPVPIVKTPFQEGMPSVSPDGRWLAYTSDETGRLEIYVRPFPGAGGRVQVSTDGGREPRWTPDGTHVVYRGARAFWSAALTTAAKTLSVTRRDSLFADSFRRTDNFHQSYDIARDGRFVVLKGATDNLELVVVTNWWSEALTKLRSHQ